MLVSLAIAAPLLGGLALATDGLGGITPAGMAWAAAGGVVGSGFARSLYFLGVNYLGPGKSLSITATSPVYAAVFSAFVLGETISLLVGVGTLGIMLGIVGISNDLRVETRRAGTTLLVLLVPAIGAVFAGGAVVLRKLALEAGITPVQAVAVNMFAALAVVAPVVIAHRGRGVLDIDRGPLRDFAAASLFMALGFTLYFVGLRTTPASVFFPLTQTQPLFAVGLSALFLGDLEVLSRRTAAGAALVVVGAALVVVG